jgi:hypothetical protein
MVRVEIAQFDAGVARDFGRLTGWAQAGDVDGKTIRVQW